MPLGSFRLNSLARYVAPAGGGDTENYLLLNSETPGVWPSNNPDDKIDYVGEDSSGRPCFLVAYAYIAGTDEELWAQVVRINADNTFTAGTATSVYTTSTYVLGHISVAAEGDDAAYGTICAYDTQSTTDASTMWLLSVDRDNLTCTLEDTLRNVGSSTSNHNGNSINTYVGNSMYIAGVRSGLGYIPSLVTRSTNTLTDTAVYNGGSPGGGGDNPILEGSLATSTTTYKRAHFWMRGTPLYHAFYFDGSNNGAQTTQYDFGWSSASAARGDFTILPGGTTSSERVFFTWASGTSKWAKVLDIAWPTSGAPTITAGSDITPTDTPAPVATNTCIATGTNEVYRLYQVSGGTWYLTDYSLSGTTITEGTPSALTLLDGDHDTALYTRYVETTGGKRCIVGITWDQTNGCPAMWNYILD